MNCIEPSFWRAIGEWVYHFQTLIAGIAAVGAAGITITFIGRQIRQTEEHRRDDIKRRCRMVKAGLPIATSELSDYAKNSIKFLMGKYELHHAKTDSTDPLKPRTEPIENPPDYPVRAMLEIQKMVEWADRADAKELAEIIAFTQVQHARMKSLKAYLSDPDYLLTKSNFHSPIMDALGVYKRADMVFPYARPNGKSIGEICDADEALNYLVFNDKGFLSEYHDLIESIKCKWPPRLGWN